MLDEAHNIEDVCRDSASIQNQEEGLKIRLNEFLLEIPKTSRFYKEYFITRIKDTVEFFFNF